MRSGAGDQWSGKRVVTRKQGRFCAIGCVATTRLAPASSAIERHQSDRTFLAVLRVQAIGLAMNASCEAGITCGRESRASGLFVVADRAGVWLWAVAVEAVSPPFCTGRAVSGRGHVLLGAHAVTVGLRSPRS